MNSKLFNFKKAILMSAFSGLLGISCSVITPQNAHNAMAATTSLSKKSTSLYVNGTYTISIKNKKSGATYTFTSNKAKVATVSSSGKITGKNNGTAKIKVRCHYKSSYTTVGTFTVTVKKATLNSNYKKVTCFTGSTYAPAKYLKNCNTKATYIITSSNSQNASGDTSGIITAKKSGITTLSIHEVYNKKSRTIGYITLISSGASLKYSSIKMGYGDTLHLSDVLDDTSTGNSYSLQSDNTDVVNCDSSTLSSAASPSSNTCNITITETTAEDQTTRKLGTIKVTLTSNAFIAPNHQLIYIGIGSTIIPDSTESGININNRSSSATYTYTPDDKTVIDANLKVVNYGKTTLSITENKDGQTKKLDEKITVIVDKAEIKPELLENGLELEVNSENYSAYPIICRNKNAKYYYTCKDTSISEAKTEGPSVDQDYLVLNTKKVGKTEVTVYETYTKGTGKTAKTIKTTVGKFTLNVVKESSSSSTADTSSAASIIKSLSLTHHKKVFNAVISKEDATCSFVDKDENPIIDYGMDLESINSNEFQVNFKKSKYTMDSLESSGSDSWTMVVNLHDKLEDDECTTVEIDISLNQEDSINVAKILSSVKVKLGSSTQTVTASSSFPDDKETKQFADGNTDFHVAFTRNQFISAGATEYNENATNPKSLSELKNVSCDVSENVWSASNQTASCAVKEISKPETSDNANWTFTVTLENEETVDFTVTLDDPE